MPDLDLTPHFQSVARSARLTGMCRGYSRVLRRMRDHGLSLSDPLFREIYDEMMDANEDFASAETDR